MNTLVRTTLSIVCCMIALPVITLTMPPHRKITGSLQRTLLVRTLLQRPVDRHLSTHKSITACATSCTKALCKALACTSGPATKTLPTPVALPSAGAVFNKTCNHLSYAEHIYILMELNGKPLIKKEVEKGLKKAQANYLRKIWGYKPGQAAHIRDVNPHYADNRKNIMQEMFQEDTTLS